MHGLGLQQGKGTNCAIDRMVPDQEMQQMYRWNDDGGLKVSQYKPPERSLLCISIPHKLSA